MCYYYPGERARKRHTFVLIFSFVLSSFLLFQAVVFSIATGGFYDAGGDMSITRPDHQGPHRVQFEKNKKKVIAAGTVCGICGHPVDKSLKYPHPMSACVDHIIPIAKGGHPSDIDNLQLAHWTCNRQKSDKLVERKSTEKMEELISNRVLPHSYDWINIHKK